MADTPTGETVTQGDSQTTATTTSVPATDNASAAEVERLRKENEQRELRIRQLENERKTREEADREAEAKRLEETQEYKTLYEKNQAELTALRESQEREERRALLNKSTEDIFKDYPTEVVELAKTAGLSLNDDSDIATAALKEKLDAFKAKVSPAGTVTSSNPSQNSASPEAPQDGSLGRPRSLGVDTGKITLNPEPNKQKIHDYLGNLQSIKQMKLDSGHFKESA